MPTETPTETLTPTLTETPTATPTATLNYYIEVTTPAGEPAHISREMSIADFLIILLLLGILLSIWSMWIASRLRKDK